MDNFALVIHPLNPRRDMARKYPLLAKALPTRAVHFLSRFWPPLCLSHITGVRSEATGKEIGGWLLACPLTARQMLEQPPERVYRKLVQTGGLARTRGARILGLLAFTSVVGDGGVTVAQRLGIPVTNGRSLTVAFAVEALDAAARRRGIDPKSSIAAVVGATGNIGSACAEMLAPIVAELVLIGRHENRLASVEARVRDAGARAVRLSTCVEDIRGASLILSATNAARSFIEPDHLARDAIICDVAQPPDVSPRVITEREDVLLINGGVVDVPGEVDFGFGFGLKPGQAYACMAETMVLALEGRYENYSIGKEVQLEQVREIAQLARRHGFRLSPIGG
jgi:predicted amino acid dehydrogenase